MGCFPAPSLSTLHHFFVSLVRLPLTHGGKGREQTSASQPSRCADDGRRRCASPAAARSMRRNKTTRVPQGQIWTPAPTDSSRRIHRGQKPKKEAGDKFRSHRPEIQRKDLARGEFLRRRICTDGNSAALLSLLRRISRELSQVSAKATEGRTPRRRRPGER